MKKNEKSSKVDQKVAANFRSITKFYMLRAVIVLIALAIVGWWGYSQVMNQMYGRFEIFGLKTQSTMVPEGWSGNPNVLMVYPARTEHYLRELPMDTVWPYHDRHDPWPLADTLWYAGPVKRIVHHDVEAWRPMGDRSRQSILVDFWKEWMFQKGITFRLIEEPELAYEHPGYDMMILPGCLLLSNKEKEGIKKFVGSGGNLLTCWSMGCRDENAEWVGFDFLSQMIGALPSKDVYDSTGGTSVVLQGSTPLTAMIPPGEHLEFYTYNGFITMDPVEPRSHSAAHWFSPYWHNGWAEKSNSMVIYGNYLQGKFVWMSLTPETIQDRKDNNIIYDHMVTNALAWLHGQPVVDVSIWPKGYRAGGSLILDARGDSYEYAKSLQESSESGVGLDLLVNSDYMPPRNAERSYGRDLIMHTTQVSQLVGNKIEDQFQWIDAQSKRIKQVTGKNPVGIYPADWQYDNITLTAAARNNLEFMLGNHVPRAYAPKNEIVKKGGWWIFTSRGMLSLVPKSAVSAFEWRTYGGITGEDNVTNAMIGDVNRIADAGGLYIGLVDPSQQSGASIAHLASSMDSIGVWRTTSSQAIRRISAWQNLRATTRIVSPSRIRLNISNEGKIAMKDVQFKVYMTDILTGVRISSETVGHVPSYQSWNQDVGRLTFTITEIKPNDNFTLFIDLSGSRQKKEATRIAQSENQSRRQ